MPPIQNQIKIKAIIQKIKWKDPKNSPRCIVEVKGEDRKLYTVLGEIAEPTVGQEYELEGEETYN